MTMITEDYCSYEVSELLKQKACDEIMFSSYQPKHNKDGTSIIYTTCTHQMAMKWLREKGIYMYVEPFITISSEGYNLEGFKSWITTFKTNWFNPSSKIGTATYSKTYEEAIEAALKYSLENLV